MNMVDFGKQKMGRSRDLLFFKTSLLALFFKLYPSMISVKLNFKKVFLKWNRPGRSLLSF